MRDLIKVVFVTDAGIVDERHIPLPQNGFQPADMTKVYKSACEAAVHMLRNAGQLKPGDKIEVISWAED